MEKANVLLAGSEKLDDIFQLVDVLFPFHLVLDREMKIVQVGKNINRIDEDCLVGNRVADHFRLVSPVIESSFDAIANKSDVGFVFSFLKKDLSLKGQIVVYEKEGFLLYVASLVISDSEVFLRYNISLQDFAAYDSSPDFLFSMQAQENSYQEIRELAAQLQKNRRKLMRSNEELKQFAYIASHDLQSPLRTIVSFAQLLERRYGKEVDGIGKEYLNYIIKGTKRMRSLINDLLEYSRVQQTRNHFELINMNELIKDTREDLRYDINKQNVIFDFSKLPSIYAHPTLIKQLFQNLFSNAIKFRQIEDPYIQIKFEEREEEWLFSVQDNGIGFEMDNGKKIFEIFQRAVGNEAFEGTGIGLAICEKVVERHKGKIWVQSQPNVGSTFFFTISKFLSAEF